MNEPTPFSGLPSDVLTPSSSPVPVPQSGNNSPLSINSLIDAVSSDGSSRPGNNIPGPAASKLRRVPKRSPSQIGANVNSNVALPNAAKVAKFATVLPSD